MTEQIICRILEDLMPIVCDQFVLFWCIEGWNKGEHAHHCAKRPDVGSATAVCIPQ
jgi:hypothetical protein